MSDLMTKKFNWTLHKVQNPPSGHLTVTNATENHWQGFVTAVKECTKMMKADPSLNTNEDTAVYGMSGLIPDRALLHKFVKVHSAALLDTLE
jgi:hypothetical protein